MPSETAHRLSIHIAIVGVLLTVFAGVSWGSAGVIGTGAGAVMGLVNWYLLKWIVQRLVSREVRQHARFMAIVLMKMGAYLLTAYGLLALGWVQPVPFVVGLGALVGGLFLGSFQYILFGRDDVVDAEPAGSEH